MFRASRPLLFDVVKQHVPNKRNAKKRLARVAHTESVLRALNTAPGRRNRLVRSVCFGIGI